MQGAEPTLGSPATAKNLEPSSGGNAALQPNTPLFRKLICSTSASEAIDTILVDDAAASLSLKESDCRNILVACLDKGNIALALSIYGEMGIARRRGQIPRTTAMGSIKWPAANLQTTTSVVLGLCR